MPANIAARDNYIVSRYSIRTDHYLFTIDIIPGSTPVIARLDPGKTWRAMRRSWSSQVIQFVDARGKPGDASIGWTATIRILDGCRGTVTDQAWQRMPG